MLASTVAVWQTALLQVPDQVEPPGPHRGARGPTRSIGRVPPVRPNKIVRARYLGQSHPDLEIPLVFHSSISCGSSDMPRGIGEAQVIAGR